MTERLENRLRIAIEEVDPGCLMEHMEEQGHVFEDVDEDEVLSESQLLEIILKKPVEEQEDLLDYMLEF